MNTRLTVIGAGEYQSFFPEIPSGYYIRLIRGDGADGASFDLPLTEEQLTQVMQFVASPEREEEAPPAPAEDETEVETEEPPLELPRMRGSPQLFADDGAFSADDDL